MNAAQILETGLAMISKNPRLATQKNINSVRIAASLKWQQEEMGGIEHVQFSYRNGTPIVPPDHCAHPINLVRRGFIDGQGWPKP